MVYKGKHKIIDSFITACDYNFLLEKIVRSITTKNTLLISPISSHTLVRMHYDKKLRNVLNNFDYLVPDSQWVRWSIPFLYGKDKSIDDRVYGPELMLKTCNLSQKKSYRIFLYGNTSGVLKALKKKLHDKFLNLKIVGTEESRFRNLSKKEWNTLTEKIKKRNTNIIFISLGSPKQEVFGYKLSKKLAQPVIIIPVGAAFNFISENKAQAPKYLQKIGLEWFFRFLHEPVRLFMRYFVCGLLFLGLVLSQKIYRLNYKE